MPINKVWVEQAIGIFQGKSEPALSCVAKILGSSGGHSVAENAQESLIKNENSSLIFTPLDAGEQKL